MEAVAERRSREAQVPLNREAQVPQQIARMQDALGALNHKLNELRERLAPVMTPRPEKPGTEKVPQPSLCSVAGVIRDFQSQVDRQATQIDEILSALEI